MPRHVPARIYRRVPFETAVRVELDRFHGFVEQYSANLSLGGMFIASAEPPPVGAEVTVEFRLGDGFELIRGHGRVAWLRTAADDGGPAGFGLRFLELTPGSRELIFRLVERRVREGERVFDLDEGAPARPEAAAGAGGEELAAPPWELPPPPKGGETAGGAGPGGAATAPAVADSRFGRAARELAEPAVAPPAPPLAATDPEVSFAGLVDDDATLGVSPLAGPGAAADTEAGAGTADRWNADLASSGEAGAGDAGAGGEAAGSPAPGVLSLGEELAGAGVAAGGGAGDSGPAPLEGLGEEDAAGGSAHDAIVREATAPVVASAGPVAGEVLAWEEPPAPGGGELAVAEGGGEAGEPPARLESDSAGETFGDGDAGAAPAWGAVGAAAGPLGEGGDGAALGGVAPGPSPSSFEEPGSGTAEPPVWGATGLAGGPFGERHADPAPAGGPAPHAIGSPPDTGDVAAEAAASDRPAADSPWPWASPLPDEGDDVDATAPAAALAAPDEPPRSRGRRVALGAAAAAGLAAVAVAGALWLTPGDDPVAAGAPPPTAAAPTAASVAAAPDPPPPAAAGDPSPGTVAAASAPAEAAAPAPAGRAGSIESIAWERRGGGLEFEIAGAGPIPPDAVDHFTVGGQPPRLVVEIAGVERPYARSEIPVGAAPVERVRTGFHPVAGSDAGELRIVFDLAAPAEASVESAGGRVRVRFGGG